MLEALWSVEFRSSYGLQGAGVVVFETGRIFGGDSSMIYTGRYKVVNNALDADLQVRKYANVPGMESVVHLNNFTLKVRGSPAPNELHLTAYVVEDPSRTMTIHAVRQAELP